MKYFLFVMITLVVGCSSNSNELVEFPENLIGDTPIIENGKPVLLTTPKGWNTYKTDKPIGVFIQNLSSEDIEFEYDYSVQVFSLENGEWKKVNDKSVYMSKEKIVLQPFDQGDIDSTGSLIVYPDIEVNKTSYLRVFVKGVFTRDRTSQFAIYVDIELEP